jgi:uncharacterized protein YdhG (YjbR/CyaY superfamily)
MTSAALSPQEYINHLPQDRKAAMAQLRAIIQQNIPEGFKEVMSYGAIGYVVPHTLYPNGYHCDPKLPMPFLSIASQKSHIAVYHMGIYARQELLQWFTDEYAKHSKTKLDMGKSCIRFKKSEQIPFSLIGKLAAKMTPADWISTYETGLKR